MDSLELIQVRSSVTESQSTAARVTLLANIPKAEHRILRIGLSFETLQQHSSFPPYVCTTREIPKRLGDTLHQLDYTF